MTLQFFGETDIHHIITVSCTFKLKFKLGSKVIWCHESVCKGVLGEHSSLVLHISACLITAFVLDYVFKGVYIASSLRR